MRMSKLNWIIGGILIKQYRCKRTIKAIQQIHKFLLKTGQQIRICLTSKGQIIFIPQLKVMVLLDIDHLNLLVLFILAFISYKSYQADDALFDSESQQDLSQTEGHHVHTDRDQGTNLDQQPVSQIVQQQDSKPSMKRELPQTSDYIPAPVKIIGEELQDSSTLEAEIDNHSSGHKFQPSIQLSLHGTNYSQLYPNTKQLLANGNQELPKSKEIHQSSQRDRFQSLQYRSSDESSSSYDSIEDGDSQKNPEAPQKLKKIKKAAKRLRSDLKRQGELLQKLAEDIQLEIQSEQQQSKRPKFKPEFTITLGMD